MIPCPNCGTKSSDIICLNCSYLIEREDFNNFFTLFFVSNRLSLENTALESRYYELSKKIHPDLYNSKDAKQKELSIKYSSMLNEGFKTLKNPFSRANYFLELNNNTEFNKDIPKALITEIFEIQELLEIKNPDKSEIHELENFYNDIDNKKTNLKEKLISVFNNYDNKKNKDETITEIKDVLSEYNYINRLLNQIDDKLESNE